ncbi:polysaccharide deacetylase family protein [Planomonospora sp. ID82291]|uniref:polysaccharide deacetylase family protein n=1 Tax=Planomonospora sp. ID82291 TaxID=2738136 RepID=UPI0018C3CB17|nr:polysaccharide deacetylase family protein [Planomonospora sp. ID82291]MBG0813051.1 polysaccharide deacetylase family protein [Planomonospora sp. ID82291]
MKTPGRLAGTLTALALLALLASPGASAQAAAAPRKPVKPKTIVALTFDDGDATHAAAARMLEKHGMRGTFYVNSATIGIDGKLTEGRLAALARAGHEIGGHTLTHVRLNELLPGEQRVQICDDRRALMKLGHRVTTLAYPFGAVNADAEKTARLCGYNAARAVSGLKQWSCPSCPGAESLPPADRWAVRAPGSIRDDTPVRHMRQQVVNAEKAGGGLVPLIFHMVCDDCGTYSTSPERLEEFLGWLEKRRGRGTVVRTMDQAIGGEARPLPAE